MLRSLLSAALLAGGLSSAQSPPAKTELEGVWVAQSVTRDGIAAAADVVARTRYTFKGHKLFIRGNYATDREDELTFTIDATDTPKYLDLTDANGYPTAAIYELKDEVLTICLSRGERPAECTSKASRITRIVLKKEPPQVAPASGGGAPRAIKNEPPQVAPASGGGAPRAIK
jgi:uncharacterized protein (TIGR03067 family)